MHASASLAWGNAGRLLRSAAGAGLPGGTPGHGLPAEEGRRGGEEEAASGEPQVVCLCEDLGLGSWMGLMAVLRT